MKLIDEFKGVLPSVCLITDDPYRVKMIAAHYLDKVQIFTEIRGQVGITGEFQGAPLTILSTGIGVTSTMAYLKELCSKSEIKRIVYFGDCVTNVSNIPVGSTTYITKAYENDFCFTVSAKILKSLEIVMRENNIIARPAVTTTDENFLIEKKYKTIQESNILDFTSSALYKFNRDAAEKEIISILNVCENVVDDERIEEAVRQSGCHSAIMLALHTLIFKEI